MPGCVAAMTGDRTMDQPDPAAEEKARLRRAMRERLATVTPSEAVAAGRAIAGRIEGRPPWDRAERIGLFVSQPDEIDTGPLIERARRACKRILLPRVVAGPTPGLEFAEVLDWSGLERGRFGIDEPPKGWPATSLVDVDLLLVPGLAFDRNGGRLGRGGGYYDRALAEQAAGARTIRMGIGFHFQLVERVPMTAHDRHLDAIVTDRIEIGAALGAIDRAP